MPARPGRRRLRCGSCTSAHGLRFTLPSHARSPSRSCASLASLWPARPGTCTPKIAPMLGAHEKGRRWRPSCFASALGLLTQRSTLLSPRCIRARHHRGACRGRESSARPEARHQGFPGALRVSRAHGPWAARCRPPPAASGRRECRGQGRSRPRRRRHEARRCA